MNLCPSPASWGPAGLTEASRSEQKQCPAFRRGEVGLKAPGLLRLRSFKSPSGRGFGIIRNTETVDGLRVLCVLVTVGIRAPEVTDVSLIPALLQVPALGPWWASPHLRGGHNRQFQQQSLFCLALRVVLVVRWLSLLPHPRPPPPPRASAVPRALPHLCSDHTHGPCVWMRGGPR